MSASSPNDSSSVTAAAEPHATPSACIYIGNLPSDATPKMIFDAIGRAGPVEALRILPDKGCAFLDMVNVSDAQSLIRRKTTLRDHPEAPILILRPSKHVTSTSPQIKTAIRNGATRSLYIPAPLAQLEEFFKEDILDAIKCLADRDVCFVHFLSVADSIAAMERFARAHPTIKVNFAEDRCALTSRKRPSNSPEQDGAEAGEIEEAPSVEERNKRTIYLGGVHPSATLQDVADVVRGGPVESLRLLAGKNSAFVSFIEHEDAKRFLEHSRQNGLYVCGQMVKNVNWGDSRVLHASIIAALRKGASRVVFIGNVAPDAFTVERLYEIASQFGSVESVKIIKEKGIAFISYGELRDAIKAHNALTETDEFRSCRIAFGRDRCAEELPSGRPMGFYSSHQNRTQPHQMQALSALRNNNSGRFSNF